MESLLPYLPVLLITVFLNTADVYFLQSDAYPRLQFAPSYWLYLLGHALVSLGTAFLLYEKSELPTSDWPIVTMVAALAGFSVLQSFTLKFGEKGIDARELFDSWKRRVIADVSQSNTSRKRAKQMKVAQTLAKKYASDPGRLDAAIHQLAPSLQLNAQQLLDGFKAGGVNAELLKGQWLASVDLEFAENLAQMM